MSEPELVQIDYDEIVRTSDDAILISVGDEEIWIPKSQIEEQGKGWLEIPEWLATKEGLT